MADPKFSKAEVATLSVAIAVVVMLITLSVILAVQQELENSYDNGYVAGQVDYQNGKIKYLEVETTSKIITRKD